MELDVKFKCCAHCYNEILEESQSSAETWVNMCSVACKTDGFLIFKLENKLEREFFILEDLGFVVTHETDETLNLYMCGQWIDHELDRVFCIDMETHSEEI